MRGEKSWSWRGASGSRGESTSARSWGAAGGRRARWHGLTARWHGPPSAQALRAAGLLAEGFQEVASAEPG